MTVNGKDYFMAFEGSMVTVNGKVFQVHMHDEVATGTGQSAAVADGVEIQAQMPGVVQSLSVNVGDRVTSGQTVLVLEAMKMQVQIGAPAAGRVQSISVKPGDQVTTGQVLAHLEAT